MQENTRQGCYSEGMGKKSEAGSAIFMILIAVVLFAALSYAVAQMIRSGDPNVIGKQQASIFADEILSTARQYRQAVQTLRISNGCDETEISFTRTAGDSYEHSPVARNDCKIHHVSGGGLSYAAPAGDVFIKPNPFGNDWFISGYNCVPEIGTGGTGCAGDGDTGNSELVLIAANIKRSICVAINNRLGIGAQDAEPPLDTNDLYFGPYTNTDAFGDHADFMIGDAGGTLDGQMAGCFGNANLAFGETIYLFYQVLIAR